MYLGSYGIMRSVKVDMNGMVNVPIQRSKRKSEVLLGKAIVDISEKKKALRPKADKGNAVAVPR